MHEGIVGTPVQRLLTRCTTCPSRLDFIHQETRSDGAESNVLRLDNPEREDG
ncbi:hypothetical protein GCM10009640_25520 [Agrococcus citreus]|uniref:Uncharacterized protein n=1 Tax=Agrococcus citreus TaxID=84643 RepID=A0ABN1YZC6_9MICO